MSNWTISTAFYAVDSSFISVGGGVVGEVITSDITPLTIPTDSNGKMIPCGILELRGFTDMGGLVDPATFLCWNNPGILGAALRVYWRDIQPTSPNVYDWSYIDAVAAQAALNNKMFSIAIGNGFATPSWASGYGFSTFLTDGSGVIPAPWDPIYQGLVTTFVQALADRYDSNPNLSYVIITGMGWQSSSELCRTNADISRLSATTFNGVSGFQLWVNDYPIYCDIWRKAFTNTTLILNFHDENDVNQDLDLAEPLFYSELITMGPKFGIKWNALISNTPVPAKLPYKIIANITATNVTGLQYNHAGANDNGGFDNAASHGINVGAHFIEVYDPGIVVDVVGSEGNYYQASDGLIDFVNFLNKIPEVPAELDPGLLIED